MHNRKRPSFGLARRRHPARHLFLEALETRNLLAGDADFFDPLAGVPCATPPCDAPSSSPAAAPEYLAEGEHGDFDVVLRFEVTDTNGAPITTVAVGEEFHLDVYVQDHVDPAEGVFAAYLDIEFQSGLIAASDLEYDLPYENVLTGDITVDGLINEAGAVAGLQTLGADEYFLLRVPFLARAPGAVNFVGNPADVLPQHHVLRFGSDTPIDPGVVDFGQADLLIELPSGVELDFGDAPDSNYATLSASGGPSHLLYEGAPRLGATVDGDADGQPNAGSTGDDDDGQDDEDGVVNTPRFTPGEQVNLQIDAPFGGKLDAWLDLNGDNQFDHPGEHINGGISITLTSGINSLDFELPPEAVIGVSQARLRVSTEGSLRPTGLALDGEVEDYAVVIGRSFVVNSTGNGGDNDVNDGVCSTGNMVDDVPECTLRAAIQQANATANVSATPDNITFAIAGDGPHTLTPANPLPPINDPVVIDGRSQPGYAGTPLIEIDGSSAGSSASGLTINSGSSSVLGLAINNFAKNGILLATGGGNTIQANMIGTDPLGTTDLGNASHGVLVFNSPGNLIGGPTANEANVISGNTAHGIYITRSGSTNNTVQSNILGLGANGVVPLGNDGAGVRIDLGANGNMIGGSGNVISGNISAGVAILGADTTHNSLVGNLIGTDITGLLDRGNRANGVVIDGAAENIVGLPDDGNVISGNSGNGVSVSGTGATLNTIQGNLIGTDITGGAELPNNQSGINLFNAPNNLLGGSADSAGNTISGNRKHGVFIFGADATGNSIEGNHIGTNSLGTAAVGNRLFGLVLREAPGNTVGGTVAGAGNVISGNVSAGVAILNTGATGNMLFGNLIGTDATGTQNVGNSNTGILIWKAPGNQIGGSTAAERNVISGNELFGIRISTFLAAGNVIQGNYIGTDISGSEAIPNRDTGIQLANTQNTQIGGVEPGEGNVISGNLNHGVLLTGAGVVGNTIQGNMIGVNASGDAAIGNAKVGVRVAEGARQNTIGGAATGAGNVISGNLGNGVQISDDGTRLNTVAGNLIGTDLNGTADLGNGGSGVAIIDAHSNTVGGTASGEGNLISGNDLFGISISGATAIDNLIQGNAIGSDISGTLDLGNSSTGVLLTSPGNVIGGDEPGAGNLISGNGFVGIRINGATATGNQIQGNLVGTQIDGMSALGNTGQGIRIDNAGGTLIGGTTVGAGNVVARNTSHGILVLGPGTGTTIRGNSLFNNGGLGIDLSGDGATPNDAGAGNEDTDTGTNNLQNFPVLNSATLDGNLLVDYSVPSTTTDSAYDLVIEFFVADASGAEGRTLIGSDVYSAGDALGNKLATLAAGSVLVGDLIVATATDANGNTSEFSLSAEIAPGALLDAPEAGEAEGGPAGNSSPIASPQESTTAAPWQNPADPHDVNNNGITADPVGDILSLVNELNRLSVIDPQGRLPAFHDSPAFYYDVNGDGLLTPVGDILTQINYVNGQMNTDVGAGDERLQVDGKLAAAATVALAEQTLSLAGDENAAPPAAASETTDATRGPLATPPADGHPPASHAVDLLVTEALPELVSGATGLDQLLEELADLKP